VLAEELEVFSLLCLSWLDSLVDLSDASDSSAGALTVCFSGPLAALSVCTAVIFPAKGSRAEVARPGASTPAALAWVAFCGNVAASTAVDVAEEPEGMLVEAVGWFPAVATTSLLVVPVWMAFVPVSKPPSNDCQFDLKLSVLAADEVDRLEAKALAHPVAGVDADTFAPA
jgi:hypothetical protein